VPGKLAEPLSWRKPSGIFVGSMTDIFFDVSTDDACRWIAAIFGIMAACPQHTFMVLTKRPENAAIFFAWLDAQAAAKVERGTSPDLDHARQSIAWECARQYVDVKRLGDLRFAQERAWPLPNCWVGVTAEDQKRADERVPVLLELPAAVRFVSYEPACGPVDWTPWINGRSAAIACLMHPRLDWVIAGGESGPGARPAHPDWFRSARDQCKESGTPFYFKQVGAWAWVDEPEWTHAVFPDGQYQSRAKYAEDARTPDDGDLECLIEDCDGQTIRNVGAKLAGRELDGRTWDGFPE
jgi:protein gp37